MPAWFYILRLQSGGLYCGSTRDKARRYAEHFSGTGCRTTILDPPETIIYEEEYDTYREAFHREEQIKRWTRIKKEALIS
jgi:predicted GIY-YIG superfamily endonuclease